MTPTTPEHGRDPALEPTPVEGEKPVPVGWWILFGGLVAFGGWYLWAYTPSLGGWSQGGELLRPGALGADGSGGSIFATVVFTALAVVTAGVLLFALSRRRAR